MLSYWAEGNSIASQALYHIRTVKAFGCESSVLTKYADTNQLALNCGIRDAWGNGITSALTGYLDLGTGVLILYFGGLLVYKNEMSVGTYFVQFVRVLYTDIHLCSFLFHLLSRIVREGGGAVRRRLLLTMFVLFFYFSFDLLAANNAQNR